MSGGFPQTRLNKESKMILKKIQLANDRALFQIGYIHALNDLLRLIQKMQDGALLLTIDNLIEFSETQMHNSTTIARKEVNE